MYVDRCIIMFPFTLIKIRTCRSHPLCFSVFGCLSHTVLKYITWLHLGRSHLQEHKFKSGFQDALNPICKCGLDAETNFRFLLYCLTFKTKLFTPFLLFVFAWVRPPKPIVSTCRKFWCLSKCKKSTLSLTSFLRYYT